MGRLVLHLPENDAIVLTGADGRVVATVTHRHKSNRGAHLVVEAPGLKINRQAGTRLPAGPPKVMPPGPGLRRG